jgi:hypothetical protein
MPKKAAMVRTSKRIGIAYPIGGWNSLSPLVEGENDQHGYGDGSDESQSDERVNQDEIWSFGWFFTIVGGAWDLRATHI